MIVTRPTKIRLCQKRLSLERNPKPRATAKINKSPISIFIAKSNANNVSLAMAA